MPIYRGAGGSGDATADSSSEALLVRELAIEVQADADAAAASATAAAGSASAASSSASAAATSASNAATSAADAVTTLSTSLLKANNLSDLVSASTARTNLGLGTAATTASTDYATAAQGATADSAYADRLKWDGGATGLDAATGRTSLGLVASATTDTTNASNISSGTLNALRLPASGVTANTYGSATSIPVITVDTYGRATTITTATVQGGQYFGTAASKAIAYNEDSIAENITTTSGKNCLSVGPITIASGFSVTIASNQRWIIL